MFYVYLFLIIICKICYLLNCYIFKLDFRDLINFWFFINLLISILYVMYELVRFK